eukprot:318921_1
MSLQEHFDDDELSSLAMEIMSDFTLQPLTASFDSFIYELAQDIEQDADTLDTDSLHWHDILEEDSTEASLCFPSSNSSVTIDGGDHSSSPMTPTIVERCELSPNDSFYMALPPIPQQHDMDSDDDGDVPNMFSKRYNSCPLPIANPRFSSPFHPPPPLQQLSLRINIPTSNTDTNYTQCLSPRNETPPSRSCQIPKFTDCAKAARANKSKRYVKRNARNQETFQKETGKRRDETKTIISPISIDQKMNFRRTFARKFSARVSQSVKEIPMAPSIRYKRRGRKHGKSSTS